MNAIDTPFNLGEGNIVTIYIVVDVSKMQIRRRDGGNRI